MSQTFLRYLEMIQLLPVGEEFIAYSLFGHNLYASIMLKRMCVYVNLPYKRVRFSDTGTSIYQRK